MSAPGGSVSLYIGALLFIVGGYLPKLLTRRDVRQALDLSRRRATGEGTAF
jgi:hypothetical protein